MSLVARVRHHLVLAFSPLILLSGGCSDDAPNDSATIAEDGPSVTADPDPLAPLRGLTRLDAADLPQAVESVAIATRGDDVLDLLDLLFTLERSVRDGGSPLRRLEGNEGGFDRVYACPDGGRHLAADGGAGPRLWHGDYVFERCAFGDLYLNGRYTAVSRADAGDAGALHRVSFGSVEGVGVVGPGELARALYGDVTQRVDVEGDTTTFETRFDELQYSEIVFVPGALDSGPGALLTLGEDDVVRGHLHSARGVRFARRSNGAGEGFSEFLPYDDTRLLLAPSSTQIRVMRAPDAAEALRSVAPDGPYVDGELEIRVSGPAGNRLLLRADSGDPDSFDAVLLEPSGTLGAFTLTWNPRNRFGSTRRALALDDLLAAD